MSLAAAGMAGLGLGLGLVIGVASWRLILRWIRDETSRGTRDG